MYWEMGMEPMRDGLNRLIYNQFKVNVSFPKGMTEEQFFELKTVIEEFSTRYNNDAEEKRGKK